MQKKRQVPMHACLGENDLYQLNDPSIRILGFCLGHVRIVFSHCAIKSYLGKLSRGKISYTRKRQFPREISHLSR